MMLAVVVPEYFVAEGFLKLTKARTIRNGIRKRFAASLSESAGCGSSTHQSQSQSSGNSQHDMPVSTKKAKRKDVEKWTITHTHFALSKGYFDEDDVILKWEDPHQAAQHVLGVPFEPPVSVEDLYSRGSSDWIKKTIAVFQILWFVIELLIRYIQHLHITAVEILTLAFIFCSLIIYGLCWNQPQNVEYPIKLNLNPNLAQRVRAPREELATKVLAEKNRVLEDKVSEKLEITHASGIDNGLKTKANHANYPQNDGSSVGQPDLEKGQNQEQPSHDLAKRRLRGDNIETARVDDNSQKQDNENITNEEHSGGDDLRDTVRETAFGEDDLRFKKKFLWANKLTMYLGACMGSAFGAVHCLLWESSFPTPHEKLAWRIVSISTAIMPLCGVVGGDRWFDFLESRLDHGAPMTHGLSVLMIWEILLLCSYIVARGTLIVLALMALRALPADSYQDADWSSILPHIGA